MKNLEDLAKFLSENPNPVLRVTKNKVLYVNKVGELLFSIKEGDKIPKLFQGKLTEALNKNILKTLEVEIDNLNYIFDIAPIKEEGYANIYGMDITERKKAEQSLRGLEWLLKIKKGQEQTYTPSYGNLVELNTDGILINNVGEETLIDIVRGYLDLLETSAAIYEKNGNYAVGIFSSGWCRFFDNISRNLCKTNDNLEALKSGKWLCHESCWTEASKVSIETGQPVDMECHGGLRIYAVPIIAGGKPVGSINIGYGDPPKDPQKLQYIAEKYEVSVSVLRELAEQYESRPPFIIDITKKLLITSAKLISNIFERKNAEVEIVNLAKFPSENPNPVLRVTKEKVIYINKAGEELFKIKKGSRIPHELLEWINRAIDFVTPQLIEVVFGDKTISFNILSIKDEDYANIYGRDITERKCAEIELQKSEATYREAYKRAEFYKDIFTHDINNILQNISNGIQLNELYFNMPDKSEKIKRNIGIIKNQVKRGAKLVSNIRKLSKLTESESKLFNTDLLSVLNKSVTYIKNAFVDKNIKIQVDAIENNYRILANELLEDILENVLTNSIKYNDSEVINLEVKVNKELRQGINYIKMQFIDNGIGITDERKQQIFISGYSEKTSVHGMGLGLSLVKKIIDSYNGEIWMEDRVKDDYTKGNNCLILIPEVINNG